LLVSTLSSLASTEGFGLSLAVPFLVRPPAQLTDRVDKRCEFVKCSETTKLRITILARVL